MCSTAVSALDIFPTAVELAGVDLPNDRPMDGASLVPLLMGDKKFVPHDSLFWRSGPNFAVRKGNWKLVNLNHKRAFLFDLSKDVGEHNDLAEKQPEIVKELTNAYETCVSEMVEPLWLPRMKLPITLREWGIDIEGTYEFAV